MAEELMVEAEAKRRQCLVFALVERTELMVLLV